MKLTATILVLFLLPALCVADDLPDLTKQITPVDANSRQTTYRVDAGWLARFFCYPWSWWPWGNPPPLPQAGVKMPNPMGEFPSHRTPSGAETGAWHFEFAGGEVNSVKDLVRRGPLLLVGMGGVVILAGIALAIWVNFAKGAMVIVGGVVLAGIGIMFEAYPWVALLIPVVIVGISVWWFLDAKGVLKAKSALAAKATALSAVVRGVEGAPTEAQTAVKKEIAKMAGPQVEEVRTTIRAAKAEAGV